MAGIEEMSVSICIAFFWHSMTVRRVCLKPGGEACVYYNIHTMHSGLQLNCNFIKTSRCLLRGPYHHMWRLSWVAATLRNGHVVTNMMSTQVTAPDDFSLHRAIYWGENHTNLDNWEMNISLCFPRFTFFLYYIFISVSSLLFIFYLSLFIVCLSCFESFIFPSSLILEA
jgi:hypothetical protein